MRQLRDFVIAVIIGVVAMNAMMIAASQLVAPEKKFTWLPLWSDVDYTSPLAIVALVGVGVASML